MAASMLSPEQVRQVGYLARLELTGDEVSHLTEDLNVLLGHFEELKQLDTTNTPPTFSVIELANVMRPDEPTECLSVDDVLANAPHADGPFFVVPRIVETD